MENSRERRRGSRRLRLKQEESLFPQRWVLATAVSIATHLAMYALIGLLVSRGEAEVRDRAPRVVRVALSRAAEPPRAPALPGSRRSAAGSQEPTVAAERPAGAEPSRSPAVVPETASAAVPETVPAAAPIAVSAAATAAAPESDTISDEAIGQTPRQDAEAPSGSETERPDPSALAGEEFKRRFAASLAYPEAARRTGRTGTVGLAVAIGADGAVLSVAVASSSGSALLDAAARSAAAAVAAVPPPGRSLRLAIRAVFSAGEASLEP